MDTVRAFYNQQIAPILQTLNTRVCKCESCIKNCTKNPDAYLEAFRAENKALEAKVENAFAEMRPYLQHIADFEQKVYEELQKIYAELKKRGIH
jgi:predicted transcriptional regulator of viral defense system